MSKLEESATDEDIYLWTLNPDELTLLAFAVDQFHIQIARDLRQHDRFLTPYYYSQECWQILRGLYKTLDPFVVLDHKFCLGEQQI